MKGREKASHIPSFKHDYLGTVWWCLWNASKWMEERCLVLKDPCKRGRRARQKFRPFHLIYERHKQASRTEKSRKEHLASPFNLADFTIKMPILWRGIYILLSRPIFQERQEAMRGIVILLSCYCRKPGTNWTTGRSEEFLMISLLFPIAPECKMCAASIVYTRVHENVRRNKRCTSDFLPCEIR